MSIRPRRSVIAASVEVRSENCRWPDHIGLGGFFCARFVFYERLARSWMTNVSVIIPALNEEEPIADVVRAVAATNIPREIIVVDNGSTDRTSDRAIEAGARGIT